MQTIIHQPGVITTQTMTTSQATGWDSSICNCCDDCGICCFAWWCFPCMQCNTVREFGECCGLPLIDLHLTGYDCCCAVCPPITIAMRAAVRERYKIQGSICDDCIKSSCLYSCTWCQMAREIKRRSQTSTINTAQTTMIHCAPPQPPACNYTYIVK
ncbi:placenta-specific gene 8 protein-like [Eleutherodactylus coqui]|uniref:placenta-specific gene 8 protein-like n=1 Tax=Eleutherodactylus coqui TaxID=57060 RepID=UPI0034617F0E